MNKGKTRVIAGLVIMLSLLVVVTGSGGVQAEVDPAVWFEQELDRARALNVSAPWIQSQAVLDDLEPYLPQATSEQQADYYYLLARNRALSGELDRALRLLEQLLKRPMLLQQRLATHRLAANTAILARRFEAAFEHLSHALELNNAVAPEQVDPAVYALAARLYEKIGESQRGREFAYQALTEARRLGQFRDLCIAKSRLAFAYRLDEEFEQAKTYSTQARSACEQSGDKLLAGVIEAGHADLLRIIGDYAGAEVGFETALQWLGESGYESGLAAARLFYARLEVARGHLDRVSGLLEPTVAQFTRDQNWEFLAEVYQLLGEVDRQSGDHVSALNNFEKGLEARHRHMDLSRAQRVAFLQTEFDWQQKEKELALLREQARVLQLENVMDRQRRQLLRVGYLVAGLVVLLMLLMLINVTRERRRYQRLSTRDGLTGLNNHTRFFELAEAMLAESRVKGQPFLLILGDIDYFKQVNDQFGHLVGDLALRDVGESLLQTFEPLGVVGRIGGEEFGIAIRGVDRTTINDRIEQFRNKLEGLQVGDNQGLITMSFGLAWDEGRRVSFSELHHSADQALYAAKSEGRNRIIEA
jgi:diguanylate cyclase (GGDEF)-like protein